MELQKTEELIKLWYNFNKWSAIKEQPKQSFNQLDEFMYIQTYSSFRRWFMEVCYNEDEFDFGDLTIDRDKVLTEPEEFERFCWVNEENMDFGNLSFYMIDEPILIASSKDTENCKEYYEVVGMIESEDEFIAYLNLVLEDFGEVTHSSGLKPEYKITSIKTDWK